MANLRVNKITSTETFETTGSVQFDGNGDYLSLADSSDFDFGSDDFTVEGWIYLIGNGQSFIFGQSNSSGANATCAVAVLVDSTNSLIGRFFNGSTSYETTHSVLQKNVWNHFALVRNDSSGILYLNGIAGTPVSLGSIVLNNSSNQMSIGRLGEYNSVYFNGHLSNFRILKGKALYTTNFTPPTRELTVTPETVLLCCQSTTNTAQEATGKTITVNGNAVANELTPGLLTDVVKSGGSSAITGSVEFDGTGDYLALSSSDFAFGTGDFTLEFWFYDTSPTSDIRRWVTSTLGAFGTPTFVIREQNGSIGFKGGTQTVAYPKNNSWSHIAYTRNNGVEYVFYNGVLLISDSSTRNYADTTLYIGGYYNVNNTEYTQGFISNLRIVKGTALHTDNFIPPTRELKKVPGTVLLCCQDSNDPTTEATGKTITPYGSLDRTDLGVELVTNGTFDNGTNSWTLVEHAQSGTITVNGNNQLVITQGSASADMYAYQIISTVPGANYIAYVTVISTTEANYFRFKIGTSANSDNNGTTGTLTTAGTYKIIFTATSSTTYVTINSDQNANKVTIWDNITVTKLDPGTKPAFTPPVGFDGSVTFEGTTKINTENYFYLPTGNTESRGRGRGVFGGGVDFPTVLNTIDYINIQSQGNAQDFGDLTVITRRAPGSCSSITRGLFAGGYSVPSYRRSIEFITLSTQSNSTSFGDLTDDKFVVGGLSNNTRGIFGGGEDSPASHNIIDYVTIASLGNAIDFGDMLTNQLSSYASCSSSNRGLFAGGFAHIGSSLTNVIQYVTISSTGNSQDFGDLTVTRASLSGCSSSIRGVFAGGNDASVPAVQLNTIDYVTIASTGNAQDFGDLNSTYLNKASSSSSIRGVFAGGINPAATNSIEYITISSTGNGKDFGDLSQARGQLAGCSDSHGGLG